MRTLSTTFTARMVRHRAKLSHGHTVSTFPSPPPVVDILYGNLIYMPNLGNCGHLREFISFIQGNHCRLTAQEQTISFTHSIFTRFQDHGVSSQL